MTERTDPLPRYSRRPLPAAPYRLGSHGPGSHGLGTGAGAARTGGGRARPHARSAGAPAPRLDPARPRDCEAWLYAIDLFNRGFFWEAHEEIEPLWQAAPRGSRAGRALQGTILAAAALLQRERGPHAGAARLAARAAARLRGAPRPFAGLDLHALADAIEACIGDPHAEAPQLLLCEGGPGPPDGREPRRTGDVR